MAAPQVGQGLYGLVARREAAPDEHVEGELIEEARAEQERRHGCRDVA